MSMFSSIFRTTYTQERVWVPQHSSTGELPDVYQGIPADLYLSKCKGALENFFSNNPGGYVQESYTRKSQDIKKIEVSTEQDKININYCTDNKCKLVSLLPSKFGIDTDGKEQRFWVWSFETLHDFNYIAPGVPKRDLGLITFLAIANILPRI